MTQPNDLNQVVPAPNWCPTCRRRPNDPMFCSDGFHDRIESPTPAEARGEDEADTYRVAVFVGNDGRRIVLNDSRMPHLAELALMDWGQKRASERGLTKGGAGKVVLDWATLTTPTADDYATLARQLAEAKAENERLRSMLPDLPRRQRECTTLDDWRMAALYYESSWGAASHHCAVIQTRAEQAAAQLAQAERRLAAVEGLSTKWRHDAQGCGRRDAHAAGTWRSCARELYAALQPKESTND